MKPLRFIHIPKNAGTAIEAAGEAMGHQWGAKDQALWDDLLFSDERLKAHHAIQHLPWTVISEKPRNQLLRKADWFAVVRHPQERVVSEFFCRFGNWGDRRPERMNAVIRKNLVLLICGRANDIKGGPGHWLPQADFTHPGGRRVARYVLAFSHLQEEWQLMMQSRGQNPPPIPHVQPAPDAGKTAQRPQLDALNRLLVRLAYRRDYRLLREHWERNIPRLDDVPLQR